MGRQTMRVLMIALCVLSLGEVLAGRHHKSAETETTQHKSEIKHELKKADAELSEVATGAKKIADDTMALEDGMLANMQGEENDSQKKAVEAIKADAKKVDLYAAEKDVMKHAKKAKKLTSKDSKKLQSAETDLIQTQTKAQKLTEEMAKDYNTVEADAGDLKTLNLKGIDPKHLPKDVQKDVDMLNEMRIDAGKVAKGEKAALAKDKEAEVKELGSM